MIPLIFCELISFRLIRTPNMKTPNYISKFIVKSNNSITF